LLGALLIIAAIRLAVRKEEEIHPERNPVVRLFRRVMPVTDSYEDDRFFIRRAGRLMATPLFVVVLVVETSDIVFAIDSVPAVLGITTDRFIAYSSNVCAILGLRALYFALAGVMGMFRYLHAGLVAVLLFIGVKLLISEVYEIPVGIALAVVGGLLTLSIVLSLLRPLPKGSSTADAEPGSGAMETGE
jgi:tellurite resistance protein TerC